MSIYHVHAKETVFYDFYIRADNQDEAENAIFNIDENLEQFVSDSEGFELDKGLYTVNLGDAPYLPEHIKIIDANKTVNTENENFLLKLTRTRTNDLKKMFDKEVDQHKADLIERQIDENLSLNAYLFIREELAPKTIEMLLNLQRKEQLFFFTLYVGEDNKRNLYPDLLVEALQEFDI